MPTENAVTILEFICNEEINNNIFITNAYIG